MENGLIKKGLRLNNCSMMRLLELIYIYGVNDKRIPIFYSGMLSGSRAVDNSSYDWLIWHFKCVLSMQNENSSQLRVNS